MMAEWVLRSSDTRILEPSVGDGVFVRALDQLTKSYSRSNVSVIAVDLNREAIASTYAPKALQLTKITRDFHTYGGELVDAIIGNPPFVRLRHIEKALSETAKAAYTRSTNRRLDNSASIWLSFVAHATTQLRKGGRLALVLPYEATYVAYGLDLWRFLGSKFGQLKIVRIRERLFPDLLQDVVLLFADSYQGETESVEYVTAESLTQYRKQQFETKREINISDILNGHRPFKRALASPETLAFCDAILQNKGSLISSLGTVRIGYVAGDKEYFHPSQSTIGQYKIPKKSLVKAIADSRTLSKAPLKTSKITKGTSQLFLPQSQRLTAGERRYVEFGEQSGVASGYKCSKRTPWYVVPYVKKPDVVWGVFGETPICLENDEGYVASNSVLCGYLKTKDAKAFVDSWFNTLTLLQLEIMVHALGGGVFVLVPREVGGICLLDNIQIPSRDRRDIENSLSLGQTMKAYEIGSRATLKAHPEIKQSHLDGVLEDVTAMRRWRKR